MKTKVAIVKCPDYELSRVEQSVQQGLELIGGLDKIVKPGQKVLLKVNALMDTEPDKAVTTHPALVKALVKELNNLGAKVYIGDSPGNAGANIEKTMQKAEYWGIPGSEILNFQTSGIANVPSPSNNQRIKTLKIAQAVLDVDIIINLPKLKTHGWTLFTGAIKNMFGSVPGFFKSKYHIIAPQPFEFSEMLVDILAITKPQLHIMDAVIGMEGEGPSAGKKRHMGALLFSTDAVAMDAVCSVAIGYKPLDIDTTKIAHKRGLGTGDLGLIEIVGLPLEEITHKDWKHAASTYSLTRFIPSWANFLFKPVLNLLRINPEIIQEKCTKCLVCVKGCPAKTIKFENNIVKIDLKDCIMCFCCHELCAYKAIKLKRSWLTKLMGITAPE